MKWKKMGRIFHTNDQNDWMCTYASLPVVEHLREDIFRIYFSPRDSRNRSNIAFIEIDINDPTKILRISEKPVMLPGKLGTFDDSGVMPSSIVNHNGKKFLYYLGWNQRVTVPYSNAIGLAVSEDGGETFERMFDGAVIDRTNKEPYFSASCEVKIENDLWKMWYLSCTGWALREEGPSPFYHIKYAESKDGISWQRKDEQVGITVSETGWDSEMIEYPFVFDHKNNRYMIYNGNEHGRDGLGIAILEK